MDTEPPGDHRGRVLDGLAEWQLSETGGLQVFEQADGAVDSVATLIVDTVAPVADHLSSVGLDAEVTTVSSGLAVAR